jgi:hypothetical protein
MKKVSTIQFLILSSTTSLVQDVSLSKIVWKFKILNLRICEFKTNILDKLINCKHVDHVGHSNFGINYENIQYHLEILHFAFQIYEL